MKKLFSLLTAFLFAGSMMAADSYVKVTEAPTDWSGDYLIVYEGDATHDAVAFNGGLETLDANSNNIAVTITDGVIAATDELNAAKFTIAAVTGGYSVQAANGKFIGATAYANSLVAVDEAIVNSLSISNGNAVIGVTTSGGDVTLRYNYAKNTWRFRYYKSGQQAIALYKFVAEQGGETPAEPKFYITGESLVGSWEPNALPSYEESYVFEELAAGEYVCKITVDGTWATAKGWSDLTTVAPGVLQAQTDDNIYFKLDEAGKVTIHYDGEYFFLTGNFHVEPAPAATYYMKNNWDGGEWSWKEMVKDDDPEETRETHVLANVVFGGTGVNINTAESDEGAFFVAKENIVAFDLNYDAAELGELDTVVFYFHPDEVNRYNLEEENGLAALIIGKYVAPIEPEHTYTVAGNSDIAFGTKWDPTNTDNDMALQEDGSYKWEKSELELPAGTISFKVCEDHAWNVSYPSQDYALAIPEAGIYTITITFNAGQVAAEAVKTGSAEIDPTVSIMGSWDSWAKELVFTLAEDKLTATLEHEFTETATYEFKVILNGNDWRSNGYEYHRDFTGAEGITGNADNMKLVVDKAGKYIITWTFETNGINIEFPLMTDLDLIGADGKAVKVLQNGQIKIMRGDKVYNAIGLEIR